MVFIKLILMFFIIKINISRTIKTKKSFFEKKYIYKKRISFVLNFNMCFLGNLFLIKNKGRTHTQTRVYRFLSHKKIQIKLENKSSRSKSI
jgi:hypothetical protein